MSELKRQQDEANIAVIERLNSLGTLVDTVAQLADFTDAERYATRGNDPNIPVYLYASKDTAINAWYNLPRHAMTALRVRTLRDDGQGFKSITFSRIFRGRKVRPGISLDFSGEYLDRDDVTDQGSRKLIDTFTVNKFYTQVILRSLRANETAVKLSLTSNRRKWGFLPGGPIGPVTMINVATDVDEDIHQADLVIRDDHEKQVWRLNQTPTMISVRQ